MVDVHIDEEKILNELEKFKKKRTMWLVVMIAGLVIFLVPTIMVFHNAAPLMFLFAVIGGSVGFALTFGGAIMYMMAGGQYMSHYKETLVRPIVQAMYPGAVYLPKQGISLQEYTDMHLRVFRGTQYHSEDLIKGKCKGVAFRQADVEIVRSSERKQKIYDVDGLLREFECTKPIQGVVLLSKRGRGLDVQQGMQRIEFENVDFNSKFEVYADDAHSAFYVITPQFMEYLSRLAVYSDDIYMSFDGEKVRLLQSGRGGVFQARGDLSDVSLQIENVSKDLKQIEEIIDILHIAN